MRFLQFDEFPAAEGDDKEADMKTAPEPEIDIYHNPHNDMGRRIRDVDDLDVGTGKNRDTRYRQVENLVPPRGTPR